MIIRGPDNLKRCAWIGEEDSLEETLDGRPTSDELANLRVSNTQDSDEIEDALTRKSRVTATPWHPGVWKRR